MPSSLFTRLQRLILAALVTLSWVSIIGCSTATPIIPPDTVSMVNEQGRERTYDLVWQDIRRFEGALARGEAKSFDDQALIILSRINRLAEGKASPMNNDRFQEILLAAEQEASMLPAAEQRKLLYETAVRLRIAFDAGSFADAQKNALTALGYAQALETD